MKPGKNRAELCYSFIYDTSWLTDYEAVTDELCTHLGMAVSVALADSTLSDIAHDLEHMQPLAFHANGSLRGKMAIEESDLVWLHERYAHYRDEVGIERLKNFVLPRGTAPIPHLHFARAAAKQAIRCLVRVETEGRDIPPPLPRLLNLMCNFCFLLTVVINHRRGVVEPVFVSKSYRYGTQKAEKAETADE
ncbi:adenosyltransferase [Betaproteobacteria bacterium]|nr:adenosyltransferase [Betaproteobacteria bacterium]GHU22839.1 adenosyltransferase [Betaproteobacteria bacterium]